MLADDLPFVEDEDPVREREDLVELERDEQDRPPPVALGDEPAMEVLDRADVEAARRLRGDEDLRVAIDLARRDELLLIAAGEAAGAASAGRRRGRRSPRSAAWRGTTMRDGKIQPCRASGGLA